MRFFFVLMALAIASSLPATTMSAKVNLSGRIIDADYDLPLEFATISAYNSEQVLVTGASTDSTGRFSIRLPKGQYNIQFEFIGYTAIDTTLEIRSDYEIFFRLNGAGNCQ